MSNRTSRSRLGSAPAPSGPRRDLPIVPIVLGGVLLLALVAVLVGVLAGDDDTDDGGLEQTQPVDVDGEALPQHGAAATDAAIGAAAPELRGSAFDGSAVVIGDDGRAKVLVFLAHWCPHCQAEVPRLVEWMEENGVPDDVDVYGVATSTSDERPNFPPSAWLEDERWEVPTLADDEAQAAASAYGLATFPYFVAIGADGAVTARTSGELSVDQWEAFLDEARS